MKITVCASAKATWALGVFSTLWQKYNCPDVEIACENLSLVRELKLPYRAKQVGETWSREEWSNGLIRYLHSIPDQFLVLMLEDYWLTREVDWHGIESHLLSMMQANPNIIRVDLSSDRLYTHGPRYPAHDPDFGTVGYYDLVSRPNTQYQLSLQPAIWNKRLLLEVLRENWSPWDVELNGTSIINARPELLVLGTRQNPIRFTNGLNNDANTVNLKDITDESIRKFIPADKEVIV